MTMLTPFCAHKHAQVYIQAHTSQHYYALPEMQMLEDQAASGNAEALEEFLQKYAGSKSFPGDRSSRDNIPAQYGQQDIDLTTGERSITSSVRWMNAF